jgi:hypothetical protein
MILGLSVAAFTTLHVVISLVGIATGIVVLLAMLANRHLGAWTAVFLATTVATSVTGFFFPLKAVGPPHIVGAISLVVLAVALYALYGSARCTPWPPPGPSRRSWRPRARPCCSSSSSAGWRSVAIGPSWPRSRERPPPDCRGCVT